MAGIRLQDALNEFKTVYMPSKNLASRSREEYTNDLEDLLRFLDQTCVVNVTALNISLLDRYLANLDDRKLAGSTRKRKVIVIRSFLAFLYRNRYLTNDISKQLIPPYGDNNLPRVLTNSEYQRLLNASSGNARDYAIIQVILQTGLRLSELVNLTLADLTLPDNQNALAGLIRVTAGGRRRSRELPLNSKACQALMDYLNSRPDIPDKHVFINNSGQTLGERGVQKIVDKYMTQVGLRGTSVQTLRHTFAVQHLIKGTSLETIREVLGHRDIRTTERYIQIVKEMAKKELEDNAL